MLASPSSSISASTRDDTYASPRHPKYTSAGVDASPAHSSSTNTSSAYSQYTTQSQAERVHDVLVDKVLHQPLPIEPGEGHVEPKGAALRRLIAFLDGDEWVEEQERDEDADRRGSSQDSQEQQHRQAHVSESARSVTPVQNTRGLRDSDHARQHTPELSTPPASRTPPTSRRHVTLASTADQPEEPRAGPSRVKDYLIDQGPRRYQYREDYHEASPPRQDVWGKTATHRTEGQRPQQSMLLSTQSQLDRLKSEVNNLNALVNKLKLQEAQRISAMANGESGFEPSLRTSGAAQAGPAHQSEVEEHEEREQIRAQEKRRIAEEDRRRAALEAEKEPASDDDIVNLVRHLDSLVWMRRGTTSLDILQNRTSGNRPGSEVPPLASYSLGNGPRSDQVIFTKGNLNHLARRVKAWETVVRSKEDEAQRRFHI